MSVLLDTNVLSELLRAQPDSAVLTWVAAQPANSLFVSAVTQAEMLLGARLLQAGKRRLQLQEALDASKGWSLQIILSTTKRSVQSRKPWSIRQHS